MSSIRKPLLALCVMGGASLAQAANVVLYTEDFNNYTANTGVVASGKGWVNWLGLNDLPVRQDSFFGPGSFAPQMDINNNRSGVYHTLPAFDPGATAVTLQGDIWLDGSLADAAFGFLKPGSTFAGLVRCTDNSDSPPKSHWRMLDELYSAAPNGIIFGANQHQVVTHVEIDLDLVNQTMQATVTDPVNGTQTGGFQSYAGIYTNQQITSSVGLLAQTGGAITNPDSGNCAFDNFVYSETIAVVPPTVWNSTSGDWNLISNWTHGVPNGVDAVANFSTGITSPQTVYTNSAITVGSLTLDNSSSFQITGQGSLTMQVSSGSALVHVFQGTHELNLPTYFASNTNVTVESGAILTLANPVTILANTTVTKSGNVTIQAPVTIQAGGSLVNAGGALSVFGAPNLASTASVDLKNGSMTVDYRGLSDPSATIKSQLATGYAGGAWTGSGIHTSSSTTNITGLGWKDDPSSQSILVKFTVNGDATLDGTVNSSDFVAMASHFNSSGQVWASGDYNYDGVVNALDFNILATNFGQSVPAASLGALVPEPMGFSMGVIAVFGGSCLRSSFARTRRRRTFSRTR